MLQNRALTSTKAGSPLLLFVPRWKCSDQPKGQSCPSATQIFLCKASTGSGKPCSCPGRSGCLGLPAFNCGNSVSCAYFHVEAHQQYCWWQYLDSQALLLERSSTAWKGLIFWLLMSRGSSAGGSLGQFTLPVSHTVRAAASPCEQL